MELKNKITKASGTEITNMTALATNPTVLGIQADDTTTGETTNTTMDNTLICNNNNPPLRRRKIKLNDLNDDTLHYLCTFLTTSDVINLEAYDPDRFHRIACHYYKSRKHHLQITAPPTGPAWIGLEQLWKCSNSFESLEINYKHIRDQAQLNELLRKHGGALKSLRCHGTFDTHHFPSFDNALRHLEHIEICNFPEINVHMQSLITASKHHLKSLQLLHIQIVNEYIFRRLPIDLKQLALRFFLNIGHNSNHDLELMSYLYENQQLEHFEYIPSCEKSVIFLHSLFGLIRYIRSLSTATIVYRNVNFTSKLTCLTKLNLIISLNDMFNNNNDIINETLIQLAQLNIIEELSIEAKTNEIFTLYGQAIEALGQLTTLRKLTFLYCDTWIKKMLLHHIWTIPNLQQVHFVQYEFIKSRHIFDFIFKAKSLELITVRSAGIIKRKYFPKEQDNKLETFGYVPTRGQWAQINTRKYRRFLLEKNKVRLVSAQGKEVQLDNGGAGEEGIRRIMDFVLMDVKLMNVKKRVRNELNNSCEIRILKRQSKEVDGGL